MLKILRPLLLLAYLATLPQSTLAQLDSLVFGVRHTQVTPEERGELRVQVEGMTFLQNNEYKSKLIKGYTLPGIWIDPTVSYQPLPAVKMELGVHLLHFWGAEKYPNFNYSDLASWHGRNTQDGFHAVPIFRAQLTAAKNLQLILGTLHGKSNHQLTAPLYNDELNLSSDPETGVQMLWNAPWVDLDAWVNWESFIYRKDSGQESFCFGLSARLKPKRAEKPQSWEWYFPVQALFQHRGGEINTEAEDRVIKTWANAAAGVGVNIPMAGRYPTLLNVEALAAGFNQQAGDLLPFDNGFGLLGKASLRIGRCKIGASYWFCKDFVSVLGNPLYGAMSISNEGVTLDKPQTLMVEGEYAHKLGEGFAWGIQVRMFRQFGCHLHAPEEGWQREKATTNLAAGIYLRLCPSFLLKRL